MPRPPIVLAAADGARAEIHPHGAHVARWRPAGAPAGDEGERLFLSRTAVLDDVAAIRGGIPVIFPQFAAEGPLPRHGFARTAAWEPRGETHDAYGATASFGLRDSDATREIWPHPFDAELAVTVGGRALRVTLRVRNTGDAALSFTGALHTYLRVRDVHDVVLRGLEGARYRDTAAEGRMREEAEAELRVSGEVDRVYLDAPSRVEVVEPGRTTVVESAGFADLVLWNPGAERGRQLADLEPDGYRRMLCVEAAAVGTPVRLAPGERWAGTQTITA